MSSSRAASHTEPSVTTTVEKSQYQHFIPRLILRGFAQTTERSNNTVSAKRTGKKQRNKVEKDSKDGVLHTFDIKDGKLGTYPLSRKYGLVDMYRDVKANDQHGLEKKLSILEANAGRIIARARKTFAEPGAILSLTRKDKDTLRKFLFLMKYRNTIHYARFNVARIEDYDKDDKERLRDYMRVRGFRSPRDVWFDNIHAFLDLEMDAGRRWQTIIQQRAYPNDATLFFLHVEQSYLAFCKPQSPEIEFLLTDNVFSIFEGPSTLAMDPITGVLRGAWTEWHNFAPLSSTLIIVLRSNLLPGDPAGESMGYPELYQTILAKQANPEAAVSMLQDLPVQRCTNSYSTVSDGGIEADINYQGYSVSDTFNFKCFELEPKHVNSINSVLLQEAMTADTITFRNRTSLASAIKAYLEDSRPGLKTFIGQDSPMKKYLVALEKALQVLGGSAHTFFRKLESLPEELFQQYPLDYSGHMTRWVALHVATKMQGNKELTRCYHMLGGRELPHPKKGHTPKSLPHFSPASLQWIRDMDQAGLIMFMNVKVDVALSTLRLGQEEKATCKAVRQNFFASLHPRFIWLYIKVRRNMHNVDRKDFSKMLSSFECEGPEDIIVRQMNTIQWARLSTALLLVVNMLA